MPFKINNLVISIDPKELQLQPTTLTGGPPCFNLNPITYYSPTCDACTLLPTMCYHPSVCPQPTICHNPTVCPQPSACHPPSVCPHPTVCHHPTVCPAHTICPTLSNNCRFNSACGYLISICANPTLVMSPNCPTPPPTDTPWIHEMIELQKEELVKLQAELVKYQEQIAAQLKPQSLEDIESLEKNLNEALAELKKQKGNFKK